MELPSDFIKSNTVRIVNNEGIFCGTAFLLEDEVAVTCHHNICEIDEIFVETTKNNRTPAKWVKESSVMENDVAMLEVIKSPFKKLDRFARAIPSAEVFVYGYSKKEEGRIVTPRRVSGKISEDKDKHNWRGNQNVSLDESKPWKQKPDVMVDCFELRANDTKEHSKLYTGYSGGPVVHKDSWSVIGMIQAIDENAAYMIPVDVLISKLHVGLPDKTGRVPPEFTDPTYSHFVEANKYYDAMEYEKAIEYYDKVIYDPNYIRAWNNKGLAFYQMKEFEKALDCFKIVLEGQPNNRIAWYNKGVCFAGLGKQRYKEAIYCFDKALSYDANYIAALNNKAWYLAEIGNYPEALTNINKCLEIDVDDHYVWDTKGYILCKQGDYDEAISCFKQALNIVPDYATAKSNMDECYSKRAKNQNKAVVDPA
jgi:tetratricopeptide (TPR) repeat protein